MLREREFLPVCDNRAYMSYMPALQSTPHKYAYTSRYETKLLQVSHCLPGKMSYMPRHQTRLSFCESECTYKATQVHRLLGIPAPNLLPATTLIRYGNFLVKIFSISRCMNVITGYPYNLCFHYRTIYMYTRVYVARTMLWQDVRPSVSHTPV